MKLTRRQLVFGAAAVAAAKRVSHLRFGLTTYQWGQRWDIPTLIANCRKIPAYGLEMRTSQNYAHGVELELTAAERREARLRFIDSPIMLVGLACGERFDSPDAAKLRDSIEKAKAYAKLAHDVGATGLRVFPNDFHEGVEKQKTLAQIARSLNEVGQYAADYGQMIRLENHGRAGMLEYLPTIMSQVTAPNVRVKLNCSDQDKDPKKFERDFHAVKQYLGDTLHLHDLRTRDGFPYQLQTNLLIDHGWDGWCLAELSGRIQVPDRLAGLIEQRKIFDQLVAKSLQRST